MEVNENITADDLQEQYRELAEIIGIENLMSLAKYYGGTQIYIPQVEMLLKNVKYKAIIEEFDGFNIKKLAKKYGVSESTVYRLVRDKIVSSAVKQIEGQMEMKDFFT
ncbi:MAG: DNA-binding protein [Lachnospiraceae bacterium]|nr:DNA-binding protein [Lachnospiraceae bacterium]